MLSLGTVHSEFPPSFYVYVLIPSACNASCDSKLQQNNPLSSPANATFVLFYATYSSDDYFFC